MIDFGEEFLDGAASACPNVGFAFGQEKLQIVAVQLPFVCIGVHHDKIGLAVLCDDDRPAGAMGQASNFQWLFFKLAQCFEVFGKA